MKQWAVPLAGRRMLCAVALLLAACDSQKPAPPAQPVPFNLPTAPTPQTAAPKTTAPEPAVAPSEIIRNMEQIVFCVPIPKGEYVRDEKADLPRGSVALVHKTRKSDTIEIRGLHRSDPSVTIADYFRNTYATAEEGGKIIEEKQLLEARGLFYARGYWSNKIYEERFIEVTWLRKDEVVVYTANFALAAAPLWKDQLQALLKHDAQCP